MEMDIKQYVPHILAALALALGGGGQYQNWNNSDRHQSASTVTTHTAGNIADLQIEIGIMKHRVEQLEGKH